MKDATFSSDHLLELYERISDAEDAIPRLRRFVLDLAVRGKLVEQDASDEPAAEVLKRIAIQKPKGGKKSNLNKGSSFPFTLPVGWSWTTLSEISTRLHYGYTASADVTLKDVRLLRITDIQDSRVNWEAVPGCAIDEKSLPKYLLEAGDMLIARTGGTIGKTFLVKEAPLKAVFASYLIRVTPSSELLDQYIKTFCESGVYWDQLRDGSRGGGQPNVNGQTLGKMFVPLPPLAEQHRIVAKVDELMALCDQLEQARAGREAVRDRLTTASLARLTAPETDAETFQSHARFALQSLPTLTTRTDQIKTLRQTILNLAVRGKLVEQDAADEPAAGLLKRIAKGIASKRKEMGLRPNAAVKPVNADDAPFDLPQGWAWARFPEVGVFARGKSKHRPRNDPTLYVDGTVPFVQTGDVARSGGVVTTHSSVYNETGLQQSMLWPAGTMCITIAANIADSGILTFDACFPDSVVGLVAASDFENARFFEYFVRTAKANLTEFAPATAQKNINLGILEMVLIPLPPLAEQHRIVAKVDELMALCSQLEASLTTTDTTRSKLLNALLHEALEPVTETADA